MRAFGGLASSIHCGLQAVQYLDSSVQLLDNIVQFSAIESQLKALLQIQSPMRDIRIGFQETDQVILQSLLYSSST